MSIAEKNNNSDKLVCGAVSFLIKEFIENSSSSYTLRNITRSNLDKKDFSDIVKYMILDSSSKFKRSFLSNDAFLLLCILGGPSKDFYEKLMEDSFWRNQVRDIKLKLKNKDTTKSLVESLNQHYSNNQSSNFFNILSYIEKFPISGLYGEVISGYNNGKYSGYSISQSNRLFVLSKYAEKFPIRYKMDMLKRCFPNKDSDVSRWDSEIRSEIYRGFISAGLLNTKLARKMRSESSKYSSLSAVDQLIKSEGEYENHLTLLEEFTDSNHDVVLEELARNAPISIVKFLVGKQCVARTVQRRMEEYGREMEEQAK